MPRASQLRAPPSHLHRRSEEHTSELQSRLHLVCRLLLEKKNVIVMDPTDPGFDPKIESQLRVQRFAAIAPGDEDYVIAYDVHPTLSPAAIHFLLTLIGDPLRRRTHNICAVPLYLPARSVTQLRDRTVLPPL